MKISKKDTYSTGDIEEETEILYCPYCSRYDIPAILHFRTGYNEVDKELWRQCDNCKRVLPASSGKKHSVLGSNVEAIDSPFDKANIVGIQNKTNKTYMQKYRDQLRKKAGKEKDEEVKREIMKGNEVTEGMGEGGSYVDG